MSEKQLLIVEDEKPIADILAYGFRREGFAVRCAYTGAEGLRMAEEERPDLVLLDWMLPDLSGVDVCRMLTETYNVPIVMLTARSSVDDKLLGLETGADDYITKPFDVREVVARIKATFRRLEKTNDAPPARNELRLHFAGLTVTPSTMTVEKNGRQVDLTPLEYQLLMYFYENRNVALSREKILGAVWGYDYFGNTRTVDIHVLRLRKKLGLDNEIRTIFKIGYIFEITD